MQSCLGFDICSESKNNLYTTAMVKQQEQISANLNLMSPKISNIIEKEMEEENCKAPRRNTDESSKRNERRPGISTTPAGWPEEEVKD
ncbi:MAG TPA: hypothetical protein VEY70_18860 [Metabacillus sp.]|nr:hypothetical protein [Metabacillus sp.]